MSIAEMIALREELCFALHYFPERDKSSELQGKITVLIEGIINLEKAKPFPELLIATLAGKVEAYENILRHGGMKNDINS